MEIEVRDAGLDRSVVSLLKAQTQGDLALVDVVRSLFLTEVVEPLRTRIESRADSLLLTAIGAPAIFYRRR